MTSKTNGQLSQVEQLLNRLCHAASSEGQQIDLKGCSYGIPHWEVDTDFITATSGYYYFLAGFVRVNQLSRVLEIGTHCGGSIKSMIRGLPDQDTLRAAKFVTVDISYLNEEGFQNPPDNAIERIQGNAADAKIVKKIVDAFNNEPIDLLFIDAEHSFEDTAVLINTLATVLRPQWLIIDDIHLNGSMEKLWTSVAEQVGELCFDATEHSHRGEAGMGVVLLRNKT